MGMCELLATNTTCYLGQIQPFMFDIASAMLWGGLLATLVGLTLLFIGTDIK